MEPGHGVEAGVERFAVEQGLPHPTAEHPPAHRRAGLVDRAEQRLALAAPAPGLGDLQIAACLGVQRHVAVGGIGGERGHALHRRRLGPFQIGEDGARRGDGQWLVRAAERLEGGDAEAALEAVLRIVEVEVAVGGLSAADRWSDGDLIAGADEELGGGEPPDFEVEAVGGELGGGELAGAHVEVGQAGRVALDQRRGEEVVALAVEQVLLDERPRSHHPHHVPFDQAFARFGGLLADGDLVAGVDQTPQVVVEGVVGNPRHGVALPLAHLPRGEGDAEGRRGGAGVVLEGLVEVPEAEEQDDVGETPLYLKILAPERRVGHNGGIVAHAPARRQGRETR